MFTIYDLQFVVKNVMVNVHELTIYDAFLGISTLNPPKIVVISIIFLQLLFFCMDGHHILDFFCFFKVYLINLNINLINCFFKSKK
jgi:hypothetical protein